MASIHVCCEGLGVELASFVFVILVSFSPMAFCVQSFARRQMFKLSKSSLFSVLQMCKSKTAVEVALPLSLPLLTCGRELCLWGTLLVLSKVSQVYSILYCFSMTVVKCKRQKIVEYVVSCSLTCRVRMLYIIHIWYGHFFAG